MATHPPGIVVEIVETEMGDQGRSCEEHAVCDSVLEEDVVVRLRKVQVLVEGHEETAIACIWVTDGIDHCGIGFLMRHMVAHAERYDGALAQVTRVLSGDEAVCSREERRMFHAKRGCCQATIISCFPEVKSRHLSAEEVVARKESRRGAVEKRENVTKEEIEGQDMRKMKKEKQDSSA
jgi:hypothetical protein